MSGAGQTYEELDNRCYYSYSYAIPVLLYRQKNVLSMRKCLFSGAYGYRSIRALVRPEFLLLYEVGDHR
ncbi:unnamed protein product [Sphenostylis stenocarpa]|uniref:Uncharacterized protein n=1 Tax=Sphenostylis stenocarpa TaxID=92480 RepID=A0AA86W672_9FABA|nr:unnamed protein product [Sphenostylis stenocarpa]